MKLRLAIMILTLSVLALPFGTAPPPSRAQGRGVDVWINIQGTGGKKINIAIPEFTVVGGADANDLAKQLPAVTGRDLTFTGLFSVVAATGAIPANNPVALRQSWADFAAAGAHAGVHGLLAVRGNRLEAEMRLYDLTNPEQRLIASRRFEVSADQPRRLAHKIADEIVLQFTGERGVADTKMAYVVGPRGAKEIMVADYDGYAERPLSRNGSINLMPVWGPDTRSLVYLSFKNGYPDLFRAFPFERRPEQVLAAFAGINSAPAWSPDGRMLALTLSKDGNPEIYVLTLATGTFRRLTRHAGIDTDPSWSPTSRELAFASDRLGRPHIFVMDVDGANLRQITSGGFHTQPRWSPRGDTIVFTIREGTHDLWAIAPDGSNPRRLTAGPGDNESGSWAPNGRHLLFQSSRSGSWRIYAMQADGSEQALVTRGSADHTSPSWSPRLP
ncbi:MAG TPA: Tol-Pal system beta propeller repeat protein TolB [Methylomirabilota bacterium]|nr:Tol-Pal system beta propeller repeat protein TolB [Methylomirabilota bacterium]